MILAAKARALMEGRYHVTQADVRALAPAVLGHRIFRNYQAEAKGIETAEIVREILTAVAEPRA
jgi:MoxR-like ATPase